MGFRITGQRWLILIAGAFAIYLALLLANAYKAQGQLRAAAEARLLAEAQQIAELMGEFIDEQRSFARELAESHEIEVFLSNRALGMSMRYGLGVNLYAIEEDFRRRLGQETLLGQAVYRRLLYLGEGGEVLADTSPAEGAFSAPVGTTADTRLMIDAARAQIVAAAPVDYRGTPGGTVVTVSDLSLLSRYLTSSSVDVGFRQLLITDSGLELSRPGQSSLLDEGDNAALADLPPRALTALSSVPVLASSRLAEAYDLAVRMPVVGSPVSVVTVLPESVLYGHITPQSFLYFTSIAPIILMLAALWIDHMRQRTIRLEADVAESNRYGATLQARNEALTEEIARREALERQVRESEERYRTYVEHAPEGIFVADYRGRFVDANPSACAMVGYSRTELLEMRITDLSPPGRAKEHLALLARLPETGQQELEIGLRKKDRTEIIADLRAIALPGDIVMGFCVDITERKRAEEQIHNLAYFDPLTGLPNRRLLLDRLRQAMVGNSRAREYGALLMLDLDRFKDLNDTQGHDVGDRLLVEVARRLTGCLRREDTVSRLGGDEYVIVANKLGPDEALAALQAELIAEKVHEEISMPYALGEGWAAHHTSASIGVALFCGQEVAADLLLKQTDVALYQAKNAGRSAIRFFNPEMQAAIERRAKMEAALRRAIRGNELRLHFQPQVDMAGIVIGAEALLRWQPPGSEPVSPLEFIKLAEETGLIIPIGLWVLEQACAQLRRWQVDPRTRDLTLSINVSARQFHQPEFVEQVRVRVAQSGIDSSRLKLELTESVVLDHLEQVVARMQELKALGLGFALDDFGTGYSSLSYLKHLPLEQVKIDKSFVRDITRDQNDAAIVRAVLAMSHSLGLSVVAEGVETDEQRAYLLQFGCEVFQGYLFGKPVPIDDFYPHYPSLRDRQDGQRRARPEGAKRLSRRMG